MNIISTTIAAQLRIPVALQITVLAKFCEISRFSQFELWPVSGKMGKKRALRSHSQLLPSLTLREESSGKKQSSVNVKSMLKLDHLKSLSIWASGEACIPSLGAVFGNRLAATAEALGVPPDPSLFSCQRYHMFFSWIGFWYIYVWFR